MLGVYFCTGGSVCTEVCGEGSAYAGGRGLACARGDQSVLDVGQSVQGFVLGEVGP